MQYKEVAYGQEERFDWVWDSIQERAQALQEVLHIEAGLYYEVWAERLDAENYEVFVMDIITLDDVAKFDSIEELEDWAREEIENNG